MTANADDTGYVSPYNYGETYSDWKSGEDALSQDDKHSVASDGTVTDENDFYEFAWSIPNYATINGILVETDSYKLGIGTQTFDYKLSWNAGSSWTSTKNTGDLPTSDTDTYIQLGGSTDTWGRTWSSSELNNDSFRVYAHYNGGAFTQGRCDHIRVKVFYTWLEPDEPTEFFTNNKQGVCNTSEFQWVKGNNGDTTLIRYSSFSFPASPTSGTLLYNDTNNDIDVNYDDESMSWDTEYYLTIWAYNTTYHSFSSSYEKVFVTPCTPETDKTMTNTGWDNITLNNDSWVNITWQSWFNDTGVSDTLETVLGIDSQYINASSGGCDYPWYYNYSDDNITINISVTGCGSANLDNSSINEDDWLFISGFELEPQVLILLLVGLWFWFAEKSKDYVLYVFSGITSAVGGVWFFTVDGVNMMSINTWTAIILLLFGVYCFFLSIYYGMKYSGRKD